ncbi:MAG: hypothetical protein ACYC5A_07095 [Thermoleophilia bacterium]
MISMGEARRFHYREEQRLTQWWIYILVAVAAAGAWMTFVLQVVISIDPKSEPLSDQGAWLVMLLAGVLLPLLAFSVRLAIDITPERMSLSYRPFLRKKLYPADISKAYPRSYHPILEYGGWGVRWSPWRGWAYNVSGNRGVQLELANGRKLLIGSQNPEELHQAIELFMSSPGLN